jgi:hypothetical protein
MSIKLAKLPKRAQVKLSINLSPKVHDALTDYATIYQQHYGQAETIQNLIPFIIATFLEADSSFKKARKILAQNNQKPSSPPTHNQTEQGDS